MGKNELDKKIAPRLVKDEKDNKYIAKTVVGWTDHRVASILSYLQAAEFPRCCGWCGSAEDLPAGQDACSLKEIIVSPQPDQTCYLFEYIEGKSLAELRAGKISEEQIMGWIMHLSKSLFDLAEILDKPLLHLDIKPGNIIIQDNNIPCLIDFDCALLLDDFAREWVEIKRLTNFYAAPEILERSPQPNSDLYSLARTAISLLLGKAGHEIEDLEIENTIFGLLPEHQKIIKRWLDREAKKRDRRPREAKSTAAASKEDSPPNLISADYEIQQTNFPSQALIQLPAIPLNHFDQLKAVSIKLEYKITILPQRGEEDHLSENKSSFS